MSANAEPQGQPRNEAPQASPQTDPTNPHRQKATGEWDRAERENERRQGEPGLTDADRQQRGPA